MPDGALLGDVLAFIGDDEDSAETARRLMEGAPADGEEAGDLLLELLG